MAVMRVKVMFFLSEIVLLRGKTWNNQQNPHKMAPRWVLRGFGAQKGEKSLGFFLLLASWTPIWPGFGGGLRPQGSPYGGPAPTKGVPRTLPRGKKSFWRGPKWHLHPNFITELEFSCFSQFSAFKTTKKLVKHIYKKHTKKESALVTAPQCRHA